MQVTDTNSASRVSGGENDGGGERDNRLLLKGKEGRPGNFKLSMSRAIDEWPIPRHRHTYDQFRYAIDGTFEYGDGRTLNGGQVAYFPAGVYYGPQIKRRGLFLVQCQFGLFNGPPFLGYEERKKATASLLERGTFENGVYCWTDAEGKKHQKEATEAVWEEASGGKVTYPEPRYTEAVIMNKDNFTWVESPDAAGVAFKWLGTFTEGNARVGFIRLDRGASFSTGLNPARELLFLVKGSVECHGNMHAEHTAFGFEPVEGRTTFHAIEASEFYCIQLPTAPLKRR